MSPNLSTLPFSLVGLVQDLEPHRCYLALLPLDGRPLEEEDLISMNAHPAEWLLGLDLQANASGLAVIAPGREVGSVQSESMTDLMGPQATAVALVRVSGEGSLHVLRNGAQRLVAPNVEGVVPDALRRALRLPTAGPEADPGWYWALRWLLDLQHDGFANSPELLDVEDVVWSHPAIELGEIAGLSRFELEGFCIDRHAEHSWRTGWSGIRSMLARQVVVDGLAPRDQLQQAASWYDDGSFSRWLLHTQPTLSEVFDTVSVTLAPDASDLVRSIVHDVLVRSSPDLQGG